MAMSCTVETVGAERRRGRSTSRPWNRSAGPKPERTGQGPGRPSGLPRHQRCHARRELGPACGPDRRHQLGVDLLIQGGQELTHVGAHAPTPGIQGEGVEDDAGPTGVHGVPGRRTEPRHLPVPVTQRRPRPAHRWPPTADGIRVGSDRPGASSGRPGTRIRPETLTIGVGHPEGHPGDQHGRNHVGPDPEDVEEAVDIVAEQDHQSKGAEDPGQPIHRAHGHVDQVEEGQ